MPGDDIDSGNVIDDRYELISMIGRGGFGDVWKAKQFTTGQLVAVKIARSVDEASGSGVAPRFKREMAVVARLSHPNIVRLVDTGQLPDKRLYAVLQLVHGVSLSELLRREGPMEPGEAKHLMMQVLDALCSAHDLGVIHRDLKPANIMVTSVGARRNAMVLDFGIATFTKGVMNDSLQDLTPDNAVGGTPAYMAPEQLRGKEPDPQTDIYAWGLVFLECITGQRVVRGNTVAETMFVHLRPDPHPLPPTVASHPIGRVLRGALNKDSASRFTDARDALSRLSPCDVSTLRRLPWAEQPVNPDGHTHAALPTPDPDDPAGLAGTGRDMVEIFTATGRQVRLPRAASEGVTYDPSSSSLPRLDGTSSRPKPVAEKRQLTAMVCELGPLSPLSQLLDPEELYEVMSQFRRIGEDTVARLEGVVERVEGARLVCYFGFPIAHEDDASRAVQAALEIIQRARSGEIRLPDHAVKEYARDHAARDHAARASGAARGSSKTAGGARTGTLTLGAHAGLHTGLVVTSNIHLAKAGEVSVVGDVARLASRLQEGAALGTALVTESAYKLVGDRFECVPEGNRDLGKYGTVGVHRVLGMAEATPNIALADEGLTFGRSAELATLMDRWDEVGEGRGQVVLLTGEAGIGKSHLTAVFRRGIRDSEHFWLECASSPYLLGNALHPWAHALRLLFGFQRDDSAETKRRRVGEFIDGHGLDRERFASFLFGFLDIAEGEDGERFRQPVEEQLIDLVFALADIRPVVLSIEDLHWADPSTQELVHHLVDQAQLAPIFAVTATRPVYSPDWGRRTHVIRMPLSRLSRKRVEAMIRAVAGPRRLPDELVALLSDKTDGVPLFAEELTKAVLESDAVVTHDDRYELASDLSTLAIPATLRGSLMARLDRLGSAKEVAQIAAIIGREFSYGLIASIADTAKHDLDRALQQLVSAELIIQRGRPPSAKYIFKHTLVQDTAYESLLDKTRRLYHARIGEVLEADFPDHVQSQPALLAKHYTEARNDDKAIEYWLRAGKRESLRSAHTEGIGYLRKGLELIAGQPEGTERDKRELTLLMALGPPLMSAHGYGAVEVERTYSRARDLCRVLDQGRDMLPVLWGLWVFSQIQARYDDALDAAEQLHRLAERLDGQEDAEELHLSAHTACGASLTITGEYARAREHFERGIAIYDPDKHGHMAHVYGQDPGMYCRVFRGWVLYAQGSPDQAAQSAEAGIELARTIDHPNSLAFALCMSLMVFQARGDVERVRALSREAMTLATKYGLMHWLAFARLMHGWTRAELASREVESPGATGRAAAITEREQGIDEMYEALAEWRARARTTLPYFHSLLAQQLGRSGKVADALALQAEVPAAGPDDKGHYYEPTWKLIRAELLVVRGDGEDFARAAALLDETTAGARARGNRMAELAALTAAVELDLEAGRKSVSSPGSSRQRLAELCEELTEGAELDLLKRARAAVGLAADTAGIGAGSGV